ncbi:hypothetical protein CgunFtcFv8_003052 [Champsocephalus gunnari]|uniref:Uncharacterized protein n=1 Tax=Champsocephalus gunnari TaxID=52237 RepID=A0AAN8HJ51_CHAGU|nr:hypothetical protein CgunFtcFv8_003052 [Champsocephalus gunnari]
MAFGARAASLDLRLLLLRAFWRLRGPPKARRVPENGSWTGAGTREEAEADSRLSLLSELAAVCTIVRLHADAGILNGAAGALCPQ